MTEPSIFIHKHILGIKELSPQDIHHIITTARSFREISNRPIKKVPTLRGKTVVNLFLEPSTRTRLSFEIAAKRMSADTFNLSGSSSSTRKGETLIDTARNIQAMNPDVIIMRHGRSGAPHLLGRYVDCSIINAGDGAHEHPSQALLDAMTILDHKQSLAGLKIAIVGDIAHSRVAHSNIFSFTKLGAQVCLAGPATFMPADITSLGAHVCTSVGEAVTGADVVMALRIQIERQHDPLIPSLREYAVHYGINRALLKLAKPDVLVMHPGPINRGVEMNPDVADGPWSVILDQVTNGVAVRMALLYLVLGGDKSA
ncbi:MAG: aspartate carbamoyltransferase catalytic subunit [Desulfofustis sp. PB-SRB1]|jgi:aspartate carbamoyltransferase catalytic subunit|nr:aspartate carbamoyltransferase catalytic subunit [Desulfofustis sp. PB-SRB1]MBM1000808.1 aspartate carbamoyltransferase catalytic subunit [Desulfofustis sp. PB-SRB1]HBH27857.1 aspartate carbamoyltransferase catalytic subunit [Desulfofustis sp.]